MIYLAVEGSDEPVSPRRIAERMGCSPSYLSKVTGDLAKGGLLRTFRGSQGGVVLAREPKDITLLDILEATQGMMVSSYCQAIGDATGPVCAFHQAMWDVYMDSRRTLTRWTLEKLAARPEPTGPLAGNEKCRMAFMMAECPGGCRQDGAC